MTSINNNKPFLFTTDENVAEFIKSKGYTILSEDKGRYVFVNDKPFVFDEIDEEIAKTISKISYTNVLCM